MAPAVIVLWPLVGVAIFACVGPVRGLIWVTLVGYLLLPQRYEIDLPALPAYNKVTAISLALVLGLLITQKRLAADLPSSRLGDRSLRMALAMCLIGLCIAPFLTVLTNPETIVNGPHVRPALSMRDAIATAIEDMIRLVPFILAWRYLNSPHRIRELLVAIIVMGLAYSLLVLFEARMSPQLHRWVYGYFQHSFIQHIRGGNFRPIVFLEHGLSIGFLLLTVMVAAFALSKSDRDGAAVSQVGTPGRTGARSNDPVNKTPATARWLFMAAGLWTLIVLLLSKNFGASMLAAIFLGLQFFSPKRIQLLAIAAIAVVFLSYPAVRHYSTAPINYVLDVAGRVSQDRADSLNFRLEHEATLLSRALEKPLFGWGGYARQMIFDDSGKNLSVNDGAWIIMFGELGWLGYVSFFGLLTLPAIFLSRARRRKEIPPPVMAIAIISVANLVYLIPNSTLSPLGFLMFGALAAFAQRDVIADKPAAATLPLETNRPEVSPYTRFSRSHGPTRPTPAGPAGRTVEPKTSHYRRDGSPKDA